MSKGWMDFDRYKTDLSRRLSCDLRYSRNRLKTLKMPSLVDGAYPAWRCSRNGAGFTTTTIPQDYPGRAPVDGDWLCAAAAAADDRLCFCDDVDGLTVGGPCVRGKTRGADVRARDRRRGQLQLGVYIPSKI